MAFHLLRIYFRAGVLVPFYLSIALALMFVVPRLSFLGFSLQAAAEDSTVHGALQIPFLSGIIGLCTLSAFLNRVPKIANHLLYSLLSWMLLPYACIAYLLCTQLDWSVMNRPGTTAMVMACLFLIVCFFMLSAL